MRISEIIAQDGLRPGQPMRRTAGGDIPGSVVVDAHSFLVRQADAQGGYRLHSENPLTEEVTSRWFSDEAMAVLRAATI